MEIHDGIDNGAHERSRAPRARGAAAASVSLRGAALAISAFLFAGGAAAEQRCMTAPEPGTDWSDCNKGNIVLRGGDLEGANLTGTNFSATDLREANLNSANLQGATLVRTSLAGASAQKANFAKVEGYRSNFAGVSAEGASFASAELQRSDFSEARLNGVLFEKAELGRANFNKAVLSGVRFPLANLARADLSGAIFEGPIDFGKAFMFLTRIEGLDLSAASGLEQAQVDIACGDAETKLPPGLTMPASWPCSFE
ncbi:pentapeptide repeat-containing protein [Mesorhizobium sp. 1B3]|uniref:pentapeptide repeat-containing protein n=1 Tax=Mesorhizobium sp. 1B3 TaxID=3243599 RepID=UPI003D9799FB